MAQAAVAGRVRPAQAPKALDNSLQECQLLVQRVIAATSRSHMALYAALDRVYAFHAQAEVERVALKPLLAETGFRSQAGAPFRQGRGCSGCNGLGRGVWWIGESPMTRIRRRAR